MSLAGPLPRGSHRRTQCEGTSVSTGSLRATAIAWLLPLAGCVNMSGLSGESRYACAAPEGVACDSVSGTYANAVHHNLPSQRGRSTSASSSSSDDAQATANVAKSAAVSAPSRQPIAADLATVAQPGQDRRTGAALRSQARVLRLWTKSWEDADGDLWDQGYVYVQVDAGRWQIEHVRQRIREQYVPLRPPPAATAGAAAGGAVEPSSGDPDVAKPADATVQRPSSFNPFPSLTRPPAGPGSRSQ